MERVAMAAKAATVITTERTTTPLHPLTVQAGRMNATSLDESQVSESQVSRHYAPQQAKERRYISQITNESVSVRHVSFHRLIGDTREHFFEFVEGQVGTARHSGELRLL
jgi:hypothetical protein